MLSGKAVPMRSGSGLPNFETLFDYDKKLGQVEALEAKMAEGDFWNNQEKARETVDQLKALKQIVKPCQEVSQAAADLTDLVSMAEEDPSAEAEVTSEIVRLEGLITDLELKGLLNGPHDNLGALMSFFARDGGTDAHDWADMLMRMYSAWAVAHDFTVTMIDRSDNEVAGINSATIAIRGPMAYGWLKGETGIHRLVRISPFNAEGKRQTSFAAVDVSPEVADEAEIEIDWAKDVREETMRAGGAGGQHVNKTESAIRLMHYATGIEVKCQNERSQHQNRALARKMMLARLVRHEDDKREAASAAKYQTQAKVGFGSQIRNYFQHPDQRIKDTRTGFSANNFQQVMDGKIQGFLDAVLRWKAAGGKKVDTSDDE